MTVCKACITSRLNAKKAGHRDGQGVCFEHAGVTLPPLEDEPAESLAGQPDLFEVAS